MNAINFVNNQEININKTAKSVRIFLSKKIDNYLSLSGVQRFEICSPKLDGLPSPHNDKARENFMISIFEAQNIIKSVSDAINHLTNDERKPYKTILVSKYIQGMQDQLIAQKVGYSLTRYNIKKRDALIEFATKFLYYQLLNKVDQPLDLCKYTKISALEDNNLKLQAI